MAYLSTSTCFVWSCWAGLDCLVVTWRGIPIRWCFYVSINVQVLIFWELAWSPLLLLPYVWYKTPTSGFASFWDNTLIFLLCILENIDLKIFSWLWLKSNLYPIKESGILGDEAKYNLINFPSFSVFWRGYRDG